MPGLDMDGCSRLLNIKLQHQNLRSGYEELKEQLTE